MYKETKRLKLHIRKVTALVLVLSLTLMMFSGCSLADIFDKGEETKRISLDSSNVQTDVIIVEKVEELDNSSKISELPEKDLAKANAELVKSDGPKYYAYEKLSDEDRVLYTEIYSIISTCSADTKVSSKDPDQIEKCFNYMMLDHPELFYLTGYSFTKYMRGGNIEKITLSGNYTMTQKEVAEKNAEVDAYIDEFISAYDGPVDDYEKVKFVYERLIKNTEYDMDAANNQNILSVIEEGKTVCQGYAKATQLILNKMGVFCILCEGIVKGTESHVWNIVRIDDEFYHVDATWGDASYMIEDGAGDFEAPEINYDYLCIPDEEIKKTHVFKDNIELPSCNSMRDNYYVREGLYLTELNTDIISEAFKKARENGETVVTLKCADANVYQALFKHLVDNHGIFEYLDGSTTVNYVQFRDACRISFYI